jgi:hypothetical protein
MRTLAFCFLLSAFCSTAQVPRTKEYIRPTVKVTPVPRLAPAPAPTLPALVFWTLYRLCL